MTGIASSQIDALAADDPAWLRPQRLAAWEIFEKLPWPTRRDLEWQPFDLRALDPKTLGAATRDRSAVSIRLTPLPAALADQGVVVCDLPTALAKHGDLVREYLFRGVAPGDTGKFVALHAALWTTGAFVHVPRGVRLPLPIEIVYELGDPDAVACPHTLVVVEPGAEATLVQRFIGGRPAGANGAPNVHASGTEVFVKEGGHLHYVSLQDFSPRVFDFTLKRAQVARDAEVDWVLGMFGGAFMRYDVQCAMQGPGGTSYMYGVGVGSRRQQFGQFTRQHHQAGHTVSDLLFKNVYRDHATGNYAGVIKVEKNANGTNAYQANRNLVLDPGVRCDTRPILEIESNELRCTHGATVGRLDENQIFYLRSRGLSEAQAREMLIEAFLEPVLARIRIEPLREEFRRLIREKAVR